MQSAFDPETRTVSLGADATPYELAHERAHQWQERERTLLYRLDRAVRRVPYFGRLTRLALEAEAADLARHALERLGRWDWAARAAARTGLWSYVRALFWP